MEDKTNREPESERHAEDHDDVAESTDVKKETEIIDVRQGLVVVDEPEDVECAPSSPLRLFLSGPEEE